MAGAKIALTGIAGELQDDGEGNARVNLPLDPATAGYVTLTSADGVPIAATETGLLRTSSDSVVFFDQVDGAAVNTNLWLQSTSGMTIAQSGGFIQLNSGGAVTANAYAIIQSHKRIAFYGEFPVNIEIGLSVGVSPQSNLTIECGVGAVSGTSTPTDGVFLRWSPTGVCHAVINFGGAETTAVIPNLPVFSLRAVDIVVDSDEVQFYVQDVLVAEIVVPAGQPYPVSSTRLPAFFRVYNGSVAPAVAPNLYIGRLVIFQESVVQNRPWAELMATIGRGAHQSPVTTFAQTANHANSTSPASATLSNTAAGYTTLGGRYQFAAVAGAATDYALFAFQVPTGYQLIVTDLRITSMVTGAAIAIGATVLDWALGLNASAVSLATADGAGTWAPRRIPLGMHGYQLLAGIGAQAQDIKVRFGVPVVIESGRFLHIILQIPVGTATASQVFRGDVMVNGYFE